MSAPSLYSLCIKTISADIVNGCLIVVVRRNLQQTTVTVEESEEELMTSMMHGSHCIRSGGQKLQKMVFLIGSNFIGNHTYKNDAAEKAFLHSSGGHIGGLIITDSILSSIGFVGNGVQGWSTLLYQCQKFGHHARCLRLHNVLCNFEICELLRTSKLQELEFRRIKSKTHVDGVCMLLNRNINSLVSLKFVYCHFSHDMLNRICNSVYKEGTKSHAIVHLWFKSSFIFESKSSCVPLGFQSFLLAGRLLRSLHFRDTYMSPKLAKSILHILLYSSCDLVDLEISDSDIAGWLSSVDRKSVEFPLSLKPDISLKSLTVLSLKGNNLGKDDAKDLSDVLCHMSNLRSVDISDNPMGDDGIRSLIPYFIKAREKTFPISDIKIDNCDLSDDGVYEFLEALPKGNEPLNSLSLADNDLGSSIAPALAEFLSTSFVRILNIEDIGLGLAGFQKLQKRLCRNVELVNINISKNRGGMEAAYFISRLILHGPNLASIDASFNLMPPESLAAINDALKASTGKLEHLNLVGNANLYNSKHTSATMKFQYFGKPIVALPSLPSFTTPYDDDP